MTQTKIKKKRITTSVQTFEEVDYDHVRHLKPSSLKNIFTCQCPPIINLVTFHLLHHWPGGYSKMRSSQCGWRSECGEHTLYSHITWLDDCKTVRLTSADGKSIFETDNGGG